MNAIILAAGIGSRLLPLTLKTPKPLIKIGKLPIIEQQIVFLKEAGINDIYVVVGYSSHSFSYLKVKYNITLIYNPEFNHFNNLYSLYISKSFFGDTWIIEGDVYLTRNFFRSDINSSTYFSGFKENIENEWVLEFDTKNKLESILASDDRGFPRNCNGAYIMSGVSYWTIADALIILKMLEEKIATYKEEKTLEIIKTYYWDQLIRENVDKFSIIIEKINSNDWYEVDNRGDLILIPEYNK
jgi:CTP:phosphocholine cytidylyltransferase-like protein